MPIIRNILITAIFFTLMAVAANSAIEANEIPEVFDYTFDDVDPIKIYAGPVTFQHAGHVTDYKVSCKACHHTLEAGETAVSEHCSECHPDPGFVRGKAAQGLSKDELNEHYLNALHAQCIDCHVQMKIEDRKRKIPVGCTQCHERSELGK